MTYQMPMLGGFELAQLRAQILELQEKLDAKTLELAEHHRHICPICDGCGWVSDDGRQLPWKYAELLVCLGHERGPLGEPAMCPMCSTREAEAV